MATYATLTVPVLDIIGADFNTSRASVWIEPNVPVVLADSIRVGGRREQVVGGVATFANLVTTDSADNPASFGYRVTITAPPKGAAGRKDIVTLTTADFPFTATANLKDIPEAWDNIVLPVEWRSAFRDEMEALRDETATISGLTGEDAAVAFLVEDSGSATAGALSATIATGLTTLPATEAAGVDPTGVANSAAGLQALLDAHVGSDKVVRLQGTFNLGTTTLTIGCNLDASNAVFNYAGTGTALQVGGSAYGQLTRLNVSVGWINCTSKTTDGVWVTGTVGLKVTNIFRSTIRYQQILDFATGLLLAGDGTFGQGGVAYNTFHCGTLNNNLVNQSLQLVAGGTTPFVNENTYLGGSWAHDEGTYPVSGMRHILIGTTGGGSLNNNRWIGCSLEGSREEYLLDVHGNDNSWTHCRWEFSGTNPPIRWRATAARNLVIGGYQVAELMAGQVIDSGAVSNNIIGTNAWEIHTTTAGGVVLAAHSGGTTVPLTVMRSDWRRQGDNPATAYMTRVGPGAMKIKNSSDTSDRWSVDFSARKMTLGAGISAAASGIFWGSGSPEGVTTAPIGATFYNYAGTGFGKYVKGSGTGNTGWQAAGFQPFTTAGRPAASLAGIGGAYFDTTLAKPVWSDGTTWRDATGTAV